MVPTAQPAVTRPVALNSKCPTNYHQKFRNFLLLKEAFASTPTNMRLELQLKILEERETSGNQPKMPNNTNKKATGRGYSCLSHSQSRNKLKKKKKKRTTPINTQHNQNGNKPPTPTKTETNPQLHKPSPLRRTPTKKERTSSAPLFWIFPPPPARFGPPRSPPPLPPPFVFLLPPPPPPPFSFSFLSPRLFSPRAGAPPPPGPPGCLAWLAGWPPPARPAALHRGGPALPAPAGPQRAERAAPRGAALPWRQLPRGQPARQPGDGGRGERRGFWVQRKKNYLPELNSKEKVSGLVFASPLRKRDLLVAFC